jgi:methyl-accepting chemotaxis protein
MSQEPAGSARPTTGQPTYRRRKFVVNRAFQFKYAAIMFVLFALAAFMVWWEVYTTANDLIGQGLIHDPAALRMVHDITHVVFYKTLIGLGLVWFLSLLLSHYLAGPLYRFEACLKLLRDGDLTHRARLRTHDELKGLAGLYNECLDRLQARVSAIREAARGSDPRNLEKIRSLTDDFKI